MQTMSEKIKMVSIYSWTAIPNPVELKLDTQMISFEGNSATELL